MPTTLLTIGPMHTLVEDVVYALPARACVGMVVPIEAVLEVSNDGTTFIAANVNEQGAFGTSGRFIRATADDCN